jgi:hypothetical protein
MLANRKLIVIPVFAAQNVRWRMVANKLLVPLAGIEPALLAELDFESSASTNSATGAFGHRPRGWHEADVAKPAEYSGRARPVNPRVQPESGCKRRLLNPFCAAASRRSECDGKGYAV